MSKLIMRLAEKQALKAIGRQRDVALTESAILIEGNMVSRVPVDTGRLRGSIGYKVGTEGGLRKSGSDEAVQGSVPKGDAAIGTNVEYAPHVEFGTKFQRPQPFMRPGIQASIVDVQTIFKRQLGQDLKIDLGKAEEVVHDV